MSSFVESRVRRAALRKGYLLRKSRTRNRWADDYGLYVLVADSRGNRLPGATGARNALSRGEGMTLEQVATTVASLPD